MSQFIEVYDTLGTVHFINLDAIALISPGKEKDDQKTYVYIHHEIGQADRIIYVNEPYEAVKKKIMDLTSPHLNNFSGSDLLKLKN